MIVKTWQKQRRGQQGQQSGFRRYARAIRLILQCPPLLPPLLRGRPEPPSTAPESRLRRGEMASTPTNTLGLHLVDQDLLGSADRAVIYRLLARNRELLRFSRCQLLRPIFTLRRLCSPEVVPEIRA